MVSPEDHMIGAYIRVSSTDQKHDSQRAEIQKYLKNNGIAPKQVEWYADTETGTRLQRPEFDRLQGDIFAGRVKTVIIWKLDRLSRSLRDGVNVLADWAEKGLKIVVVTQQLELNGVIGRTIAALLLGLAEIEHGHIRERQKAGIEAAKARGVYTGRAIGSTKAHSGRARELKKKGLSMGEIATALGVSTRTVTRYLGAR
jgi:DNA invertase Pin-like site-specific DNA recombinase